MTSTKVKKIFLLSNATVFLVEGLEVFCCDPVAGLQKSIIPWTLNISLVVVAGNANYLLLTYIKR